MIEIERKKKSDGSLTFILTNSQKNSFLILDTIRVSDIERCFVSSLRDKSSKDHGLDKEQDLDFRGLFVSHGASMGSLVVDVNGSKEAAWPGCEAATPVKSF